jgi:biotin carboxylase
MSDGRLLMLTPTARHLRLAAKAGLYVCGVWDPKLAARSYLREIAVNCDEFVAADLSTIEAIRTVLARQARSFGADWIMILGRDQIVEEVVKIAEELGLSPASAASVRMLNDKAALRSLLSKHDIESGWFRYGTTVADAIASTDGVPFPVVAKPTSLTGSKGVRLIAERSALETWAEDMAKCEYQGAVLLEEYHCGPEYSVEAFSRNGEHHVYGITEKRTTAPPYFVEIEHTFPARLVPEVAAEIHDLVTRILAAADYRYGPSHTEVIVTEKGLRVVESHARFGGSRIPQLVQLATGSNYEATVFEGLVRRPEGPKSATRCARSSYFEVPSGEILRLGGLAEISRLPFVHHLHFPLMPGDRVSDLVENSGRHGFFVVDGDTFEELDERTRLVKSLLDIEVRL